MTFILLFGGVLDLFCMLCGTTIPTFHYFNAFKKLPPRVGYERVTCTQSYLVNDKTNKEVNLEKLWQFINPMES